MARASNARRTNSRAMAISERVAALETAWENAWEGIGDKIAIAISEAAKEFTPRRAHDGLQDTVTDLEARIRALENKNSFAAGAVRGEDRVSGKVERWIQIVAPMVWPVCLAAGAYFIANPVGP